MMILKKWFTLIEILLVLSILTIIFFMSRWLFNNPNQNVINSEICINEIAGQVEQFFYNAVTGREFEQWTIVPTTYTIHFNGEKNSLWNGVNLYVNWNSWANTNSELPISGWLYNVFENFWWRTRSSNNANKCNNNKFFVVFSWTNANTAFSSTININKNFTSTNGNIGWISIRQCAWSTCTNVFQQTIDFLICETAKYYTTNDRLWPWQCIHTQSLIFDISTQSIRRNKCLGINRSNNTCNKRSF